MKVTVKCLARTNKSRKWLMMMIVTDSGLRREITEIKERSRRVAGRAETDEYEYESDLD
jgi:hypothetical protein